MLAGPHKPFRIVWALFSLSACLSLLLCRAAGDANLRALAREARREEALGPRGEASQRVLEAKRQAVDKLLAGRGTLREAAERFRELNALVRDDNDALIGAFRVAAGRTCAPPRGRKVHRGFVGAGPRSVTPRPHPNAPRHVRQCPAALVRKPSATIPPFRPSRSAAHGTHWNAVSGWASSSASAR
jgi:hypothetical protein